MTHTDEEVAVDTDAAEDIAASGLAGIQLIFDASMARSALLFEVWMQVSREALGAEQAASVEVTGAAVPLAPPEAA